MKHILSGLHLKGYKKTLIVFCLFLLYSCRTIPPVSDNNGETITWAEDAKENNKELTDIQLKLIEGAYWSEGRKKLIIEGKKFNIDCSGTVMAVYYYAGIDLSRDFAEYTGGGVSRIYQYLKDKNLIYYTDDPSPGDIIFWDNTFDSNNDGKRNDRLTHMGIVVNVSEDGTVTYLHEHYRKGIIFESMNLKSPDDPEKNSAMRMRGTGMEGGWLASHLYRESGMGYKLDK